MDKILVEVYLPAANCTFDVYIPLKMKIHEVTLLLSKTAEDLSNGFFTASKDTILCDRYNGEIFNVNMSVEELNLCNGFKLILI